MTTLTGAEIPWWWLLLMGGIVMAGVLSALWEWWRKHRAEGWPSAEGRIESTAVEEKSAGRRGTVFRAELAYSFRVGGECFVGRHQEEFDNGEAAQDYVRELEGKAVAIRYNPEDPDSSMLLEEDLLPVQRNRPAPAQTEHGAVEIRLPIPRAGVAMLAGAAAIGFAVSAWTHLSALLGKIVLPDYCFMALHVGAIVLWLPAIVVARSLGSDLKSSQWQVLLRGCPAWMRLGVPVLFLYAIVNFLISMSMNAKHEGLTALDWRIFSGHWMLFYAAAAALLYSSLRLEGKARRCMKGHLVPSAELSCPECGEGLRH